MIIVVGCGTLGSRVAPKLQGQQVVLIDHDVVLEENLPVQLFDREDIGRPKAQVLAERVHGLAHIHFLDQTNTELMREAALVIDCTDNLLSRCIISRYCSENGIPLVHGAAAKDHGLVALFVGRPDLEDVYAGKISLENCRSNQIDPGVADCIAGKQVELALGVLDGKEDAVLFTVNKDALRQIKLSQALISDREPMLASHYLTYCDEAGCMSAKPLRHMEMVPRTDEVDAVRFEVLENGEVRFYEEDDIDKITRVLKTILLRSDS